MGDLDGRTFLITGANTGIGKETARALAARGGKVRVACRSPEGGRRALEEIAAQTGNHELELLPLDLGDLASVTYSLHPGVIASDIWRRVPWPVRGLMKLRMDSPEHGARTSLYCATATELAGESGRYYDDCAPKQPGEAVTARLADELWGHSSDWVAPR